jgi:hypothetical protein
MLQASLAAPAFSDDEGDDASPSKPEKEICRNCGAEFLQDDSLFCRMCGAKRIGTPSTSSQDMVPSGSMDHEWKKVATVAKVASALSKNRAQSKSVSFLPTDDIMPSLTGSSKSEPRSGLRRQGTMATNTANTRSMPSLPTFDTSNAQMNRRIAKLLPHQSTATFSAGKDILAYEAARKADYRSSSSQSPMSIDARYSEKTHDPLLKRKQTKDLRREVTLSDFDTDYDYQDPVTKEKFVWREADTMASKVKDVARKYHVDLSYIQSFKRNTSWTLEDSEDHQRAQKELQRAKQDPAKLDWDRKMDALVKELKETLKSLFPEHEDHHDCYEGKRMEFMRITDDGRIEFLLKKQRKISSHITIGSLESMEDDDLQDAAGGEDDDDGPCSFARAVGAESKRSMDSKYSLVASPVGADERSVLASAESLVSPNNAASYEEQGSRKESLFSLEELQSGCPPVVSPRHKEEFLSDADFRRAFGVSRAEFAKMPEWKKQATKKAMKLFLKPHEL